MRTRRSLLLGTALAPLAGLVGAQPQPAASRSSGGGAAPLPVLGQVLRLPDEVVLLDDTVLRPIRQRHEVLVLYWWASWCPFCAIQSPLMDTLWRAHRGKGLRVLGLSIDKKREDAMAHWRAKAYGFPSAWVTPEIETLLPRPRGLPITVVLGRDGKVVMAEAGQLFPEDIEQIARFL